MRHKQFVSVPILKNLFHHELYRFILYRTKHILVHFYTPNRIPVHPLSTVRFQFMGHFQGMPTHSPQWSSHTVDVSVPLSHTTNVILLTYLHRNIYLSLSITSFCSPVFSLSVSHLSVLPHL